MRVFLQVSFGVALAGAVFSATAVPARAQAGLSGRRAPSFSLPDSKLNQHDILDYRGKWLLIEFMQTTCPHCRTLSIMLEDLKGKLAGKMDILAIVEPPDNTNTVGKYLADNHSSTPIVFDYYIVATSYFKATPANPSFDTPHLFAVDPNGQIVRDWGQAVADNPAVAKEIELLVTAAGAKK
ncbi:MAG TPA: TlpA disulfide reductase family protein [Bryobacteraceae bacterium]|nr:TlpA disulfide reductase family protein [Bryobacteraceae bacterium]